MNPHAATFNMLKDSFNGKLLLSKQEASQALGVSMSSINNYMNLLDNPLGYVKLGGTKKSAIRIPTENLAKFIDANLHNTKVINNGK